MSSSETILVGGGTGKLIFDTNPDEYQRTSTIISKRGHAYLQVLLNTDEQPRH